VSPGPVRLPLTPRQAQALTAAADGAPLREVGARLGITREQASSLLSRAYERLNVGHLPRADRRAAAVRAAVSRGLIPDPDTEK
jgi:DNA-binding CsgD family transcriptional regulator